MLADTAKMPGCVIHTIGMSVQTEAVMKKMPHRQSAFLDVGCDFVAVTAWMMTAYRRCQCGECSPVAVSMNRSGFREGFSFWVQPPDRQGTPASPPQTGSATVVAVLANAERPRRLPALGLRLLRGLPT